LCKGGRADRNKCDSTELVEVRSQNASSIGVPPMDRGYSRWFSSARRRCYSSFILLDFPTPRSKPIHRASWSKAGHTPARSGGGRYTKMPSATPALRCQSVAKPSCRNSSCDPGLTPFHFRSSAFRHRLRQKRTKSSARSSPLTRSVASFAKISVV